MTPAARRPLGTMRGETRFPDELAIPGQRADYPMRAAFEAAGTRAHVVEIDDGVFRLTIDGIQGEIRRANGSGPAAAPPSVRLWPFGAERTFRDASGGIIGLERAFTPSDHALVALEWEAAQADELRLRLMIPAVLAVRLPAASRMEGADAMLSTRPGEVTRVVIGSADVVALDVDALINAAVARARRGSANRPLLESSSAGATHAAATDPFRALHHDLRMGLVRRGDSRLHAVERGADGIERSLGAADETRVAIALLALNDREVARELLSGGADPGIERLTTLAGAWAIWTGDAAGLAAVHEPISNWIREIALRSDAVEADEWTRAARAVAPAVADLMGDREPPRAVQRPAIEPGSALAALGETGPPGMARHAARETLRLMHDMLGVGPDAGRGRLRLAPRLEPGSSRLTGLRVGDATFAMRATVEAPGHIEIEVEQTSGPAPYRLILEPRASGRRLTAAMIDGKAADLDASAEEGGVRVRMQLVTDHARVVVLELE